MRTGTTFSFKCMWCKNSYSNIYGISGNYGQLRCSYGHSISGTWASNGVNVCFSHKDSVSTGIWYYPKIQHSTYKVYSLSCPIPAQSGSSVSNNF